jgi:exopolyphosphatase/guanosine-5'-triphosphate,3'-diphosphate pyrophosphatase
VQRRQRSLTSVPATSSAVHRLAPAQRLDDHLTMDRVAVIDMGSNSWRVVVYAFRPEGPWMLTDEIREPVRVGAGMEQGGSVLQPEAIGRALHTAALFSSFCRASGIEDVTAVATSAIRDASNRDVLVDAIAATAHLPIRVLSGEEEAWYGYLAVVNSTTLSDGFAIDIGGGSVQLMQVADRRLVASDSMPLGAVRMSERFLAAEKATAKDMRSLTKAVRGQISERAWFAAGSTPRLVGVGGTIRNLAVAAQRRLGYPDTGAQGFVLERQVLQELIDELASRPASKRGSVPGIKPDRGDVILGGALVLAAAMDEGCFEALEVTEGGLREGVFFERFLAPEDPPLLDDVRRRSVENLAQRFHAELTHVRHVAQLSLQLYDGLARLGLVEADDDERELLWAACMLHDIGMTIDYDDHHKHSQYLILNLAPPGYTPREIGLVALIARYHRKGEPDASDLGALARKGDDRRVTRLAGIVRIAEQLERSRDQSVRLLSVERRNGKVSIGAHADGDPSVALWGAGRDAGLLAAALDTELDLHRVE